MDFVAQTGEPKATTAVQAWRQSNTPYDPTRDYYRRVRTELINYEKTGEERDWEEFVASQNPKKQKNFERIISSYMNWRDKHSDIDWFVPPRGEWASAEFQLTINPEMGLTLDGQRHAIKLFFNKNKLSKLKAQMAGLIMDKALSDIAPNTKFAIFDINEKKLHTYEGSSDKLKYLLVGETAHLSAMLNAIRDTG
ncbi:hypothetical protein [Leisingera sp. ANG-DT]|uniref:hypothetical protein n=1 Tax=Leisingera sp. ANG-DT TaxID=1577897 RepID=UPI0019D34723|nr:hypothetical protein [Leisingera sp. ANG-DT]